MARSSPSFVSSLNRCCGQPSRPELGPPTYQFQMQHRHIGVGRFCWAIHFYIVSSQHFKVILTLPSNCFLIFNWKMDNFSRGGIVSHLWFASSMLWLFSYIPSLF